MKKLGLFAVGVLFGTAGIKLLGSRDAKKVYAHTTAAALRAKEGVMKTVTAVREGAEDPLAFLSAVVILQLGKFTFSFHHDRWHLSLRRRKLRTIRFAVERQKLICSVAPPLPKKLYSFWGTPRTQLPLGGAFCFFHSAFSRNSKLLLPPFFCTAARFREALLL